MWLGAAAFARLRMPVLGRNELRQKRNVVMACSWLEGLTGASKHNHRTCPGGFTEARRIGLVHCCIAFFRPHRDTVSIPDRTGSSCMSSARRVPPGVNRLDPQRLFIFRLVNADCQKYAGVRKGTSD